MRSAVPALALLATALALACAEGDPERGSIFAPRAPRNQASVTATATSESEQPDATPGGGTPTAVATSTVGAPGPCPIDDRDFCGLAIEIARALVAGDEEAITLRSAEQELNCGQVALEVFPDCSAPADILMGILTVSSLGETHVNALGEYNAHVGQRLDGIASDAADDEGDGALRLLGVGRRGDTYDLVATAIIDDPELNIGGNPSRWVFVLAISRPFGSEYFITSFGSDSFDNFVANGFPDPFNDVTVALEPWGE